MFCNRVKEFLRKQNVAFADRDISADSSALAELEKIGVMTTPVTVVDGETVIGYDVNRLKALLGVSIVCGKSRVTPPGDGYAARRRPPVV